MGFATVVEVMICAVMIKLLALIYIGFMLNNMTLKKISNLSFLCLKCFNFKGFLHIFMSFSSSINVWPIVKKSLHI